MWERLNMPWLSRRWRNPRRGIWTGSRSCEAPPTPGSQQKSRVLDPTTSRNRILPTTGMMSMKDTKLWLREQLANTLRSASWDRVSTKPTSHVGLLTTEPWGNKWVWLKARGNLSRSKRKYRSPSLPSTKIHNVTKFHKHKGLDTRWPKWVGCNKTTDYLR